MTDQLRRALDELAAEIPAGDRIDPEVAWRAARRRRSASTRKPGTERGRSGVAMSATMSAWASSRRPVAGSWQ